MREQRAQSALRSAWSATVLSLGIFLVSAWSQSLVSTLMRTISQLWEQAPLVVLMTALFYGAAYAAMIAFRFLVVYPVDTASRFVRVATSFLPTSIHSSVLASQALLLSALSLHDKQRMLAMQGILTQLFLVIFILHLVFALYRLRDRERCVTYFFRNGPLALLQVKVALCILLFLCILSFAKASGGTLLSIQVTHLLSGGSLLTGYLRLKYLARVQSTLFEPALTAVNTAVWGETLTSLFLATEAETSSHE